MKTQAGSTYLCWYFYPPLGSSAHSHPSVLNITCKAGHIASAEPSPVLNTTAQGEKNPIKTKNSTAEFMGLGFVGFLGGFFCEQTYVLGTDEASHSQKITSQDKQY